MKNSSAATEAIPFILYEKGRGFYVAQEAEEFLQKLAGRDLSVVSVVGKYRTGKSYLINRLIAEGGAMGADKGGFMVAGTVNACTKGVWIWPKFVEEEGGQGGVLLMDTEGFGGVGETQNHDVRIFLFALLLSSLFVYNSVGAIDEAALQAISLVTNLAREVQRGEEKELTETDLEESFPEFLWVVRDFSLRLVDEGGRPLTSAEYLERALEPQRGNSDAAEGKNRVRRQFKHFFRRRDCVTMVRPVEREADLQKLEKLGEFELRPEFVKQLRQTRKLVLDRAKARPKKFQGTPVDGPRLLALAGAHARALNAGRAPCLESAWTYLLQSHNDRLASELERRFTDAAAAADTNDAQGLVAAAMAEFARDRVGTEQEASETAARLERTIQAAVAAAAGRRERELKASATAAAREGLDALRVRAAAGELDPQGLDAALEELRVALRARPGWEEGGPADKAAEKAVAQRRAELLSLCFARGEAALRARAEAAEARAARAEEAAAAATAELAAAAAAAASVAEESRRLQRAQLLAEDTVEELRDRARRAESRAEAREAELLASMTAGEAARSAEAAALREAAAVARAEATAAVGEAARAAAREAAAMEEASRLRAELSERRIDAAATEVEALRLGYERALASLAEEKRAVERQLEALREAVEEQKAKSLGVLDDIRAKIDGLDAARIARPEAKQLEKYEGLKRIVSHSSVSQCSKCGQFIGTAVFSSHLDDCLGSRRLVAASPTPTRRLQISIGQSLVRDDPRAEGRKTFTEYILHIETDQASWYVSRKFKEFCELLEELESALPGLNFPPSCAELWGFLNDIWSLLGGKSIPIEERRKLLQNVVRDLAKIDVVADHPIFRRFIGDATPLPVEDEFDHRMNKN